MRLFHILLSQAAGLLRIWLGGRAVAFGLEEKGGYRVTTFLRYACFSFYLTNLLRTVSSLTASLFCLFFFDPNYAPPSFLSSRLARSLLVVSLVRDLAGLLSYRSVVLCWRRLLVTKVQIENLMWCVVFFFLFNHTRI